jgi:Glycosyl transferase family 11
LPLYDGPELPEHGVPWGYHEVKLTHPVSLLGHFQSDRYFSHAIEEIRWYMTMTNEPPQNNYCAIHFRAGDYGDAPTPQHPQGNSFHPRMDVRYYEPAIAHFGSSQKFLVFSDDIPRAREMFGDRVDYSEGRNYFDDFRLLKKCASFIIANSSYSAFAAELGDAPDKQVVAPRPWFGGPYTGQIDGGDIYGDGWKVIDWQ